MWQAPAAIKNRAVEALALQAVADLAQELDVLGRRFGRSGLGRGFALQAVDLLDHDEDDEELYEEEDDDEAKEIKEYTTDLSEIGDVDEDTDEAEGLTIVD